MLPLPYMEIFNQQAIKLGLMGVTIIVASGDDGAPGVAAIYNSSACSYDPVFPASSPYVTAVGATMGLEKGSKEVACDANQGGIITTGGGFSTLVSALNFQNTAIPNYFLSVSNNMPSNGYNRNGRGYPDVSMAGKNYVVIIGGKGHVVSGTSAAAPVFAGMVSLINSARNEVGRKPVGWLNPLLYYSNGSFANDIVQGNNKCTRLTCCQTGFDTSIGWDPVTGFGSVDYKKLYELCMV